MKTTKILISIFLIGILASCQKEEITPDVMILNKADKATSNNQAKTTEAMIVKPQQTPSLAK